VYDAIIVGARCAGSATALLLARKGYRVLAVDRKTFPSDTMSTHYIHTEGLARLRAWGLLEDLIATGCPPISEIESSIEGNGFVSTIPSYDGLSVGYCPRRTVLDQLMVDAARAAGADIREGVVVDELLRDVTGVVTGVRARTDDVLFDESGRIVIGADGRRSRVAQLVESEQYDERPGTAFWYYNYFPDLDVVPAMLAFSNQIGAFLNPTHDGAHVVGVGSRVEHFADFKTDIPGNFLRYWRLVSPEIADHLAAAQPIERWVGTADVPGFHRVPFGAGWALVGDAGLHKDPITGSGITEAWLQAEWLADAIDDGFSGRRSLSNALADYQQRRDDHSRDWYEWTHATARLDPIPEQIASIFASLNEDRVAADRFAMLNAGLISMRDFYAPFFASA
jgi:flavin-dependent dehydrogenase